MEDSARFGFVLHFHSRGSKSIASLLITPRYPTLAQHLYPYRGGINRRARPVQLRLESREIVETIPLSDG
jgi:hypothetical protein